jgi:hypothetical protein
VKDGNVGIGAPVDGQAKLAVGGVVKMDFGANGQLVFQGVDPGNPTVAALGASTGLTIGGDRGASLPNVTVAAKNLTVTGVVQGNRQKVWDKVIARTTNPQHPRGSTAEALQETWSEYPNLVGWAKSQNQSYGERIRSAYRFAAHSKDAAIIRGSGTAGPCDFAFDGGDDDGPIKILNLTTGTVKTFIIDHPADTERYLVHGTLEGPEGGVYYRGTAKLHAGEAVIELPKYFEALTQKGRRTIILTNVDGFDTLAIRSQEGEKVKDGRFVVVSSNPTSTQAFDWEVKAVRKDVPDLEVEPSRRDLAVERFGPYTYGVPRKSGR